MKGHLVPKLDPGAIATHKPADYATRFLFGAAISLAAGLIGMKFGPVVGGVFLGFPAILPASLTLIEKKDGKRQAAIDSEGAILGAVAMVVYAVAVIVMAGKIGVVASLVVALLAWLVVAVVLYFTAALTFRREPAPP
jgi:uncharacterized membrane protein (GlpM family)